MHVSFLTIKMSFATVIQYHIEKKRTDPSEIFQNRTGKGRFYLFETRELDKNRYKDIRIHKGTHTHTSIYICMYIYLYIL